MPAGGGADRLWPVSAPSQPSVPRRRVAVNGLRLVSREDLVEPLKAIYRDWPWCYDAVAAQPDRRLVSGRRPLVAGTVGGVRVLVKRLFHGGALASLTGDRFLTARRFETNLAMVDALEARGIGTSELVFAAWRRVAGLVRGELGFREVEGARDAAAAMFGPAEQSGDAGAVAAAVGRTVARLHATGIVHHDLNLRNFLLEPGGEVLVLDVDKAEARPQPLSEPTRRRNLDRLERSVRKLGRDSAREVVDGLVERLRRAYAEAAVA